MITSAHNPRIQWVRKLQTQAAARREAGAFVIEGIRLTEEALQAGWQPLEIFYTEELSPRGESLIARCEGSVTQLTPVSPPVMKSASDTQSPQGLLAVLPFKSQPLPAQPDFLLVLDNLRNPGNLGTILRSAAAAGVQAVLLTPGCADPYSPKVLRSAMGAHFRLPLQNLPWNALCSELQAEREKPLSIYLADVEGGLPFTQADFRSPLALIVGSEAEGAGETLRSLPHVPVHIPMPGKAESLNAAVAASILVFEVVRQRSQ